MSRPVLLLAALLACAAVARSGPAHAFFAPGAEIVSASDARQEQGDDDTSQASVSADGRYAVFATRARNFFADDDADPPGRFRLGGIFRRDLGTGELRLVAYGDVRSEADPDELITRGAQNPSVSADGRWVAFSTGAQLVPQDVNGNVDVYVRDMTKAPGDPGAFELIAAKDGGNTPASYGTPIIDRPGANPGTEVTPGHAISADGRYVAFRTSFVASDLPDAADATVGQLQVLVRDRRTQRTVLITRDATTGDPVGGATGGAVLSADGSTVLWSGLAAAQQTRFLPGELVDPASQYLLWRRWADPAAVTRRVTGASDPDDPACTSLYIPSLTGTGPCLGPLATVEGVQGSLTGRLAVMSEDGRRVAFLTGASPRGIVVGQSSDLFLTDMAAGVSRKAGTVELTREGLTGPDTGAAIEGIDLSPDGRWLALTTTRTTFALPALTQLGTARAQAIVRDLYLVDLAARTIERADIARDGSDANGSTGAQPSISAGGRVIAFTSEASNLFFGDANGRADAFVVRREDAAPAEPPAGDIPEPAQPAEPAAPAGATPGRLTVRAKPGRRGIVVLTVQAPAAGRLSAVARGRLPGPSGKPSGPARRLSTRTARVTRRSSVTLRLVIGRALRGRLRSAGKLVGQAEVRLAGSGGRVWERRVTVEFRP